MKIAAAHLALHSTHTALTRQESRESLRAWRGERPDFDSPGSTTAQISAAARARLAAARQDAVPPAPTLQSAAAPGGPSALPPAASEAQALEETQRALEQDPFLAMVRQMIEYLTGEKVKVFDSSRFSSQLRQVEVQTSATTARLEASPTRRAGWGLEYEAHDLSEEFEQSAFSAQGTIRTTDGLEFSFTLEVTMSRYFREERHTRLSAGDAVKKDPLVVNFGGSAVELAREAGRSFRFDLDGDGQTERLPLFASGSGYLALDANGNGRIDSGKELFGPRTGRGFAELARLDADNNGWIDANDPAFAQLSVWTPAPEGAGQLQSLASLGIGALALTHVSTPFALRDATNAGLGVVKASGLFLREDGRAGSLQEIDLLI